MYPNCTSSLFFERWTRAQSSSINELMQVDDLSRVPRKLHQAETLMRPWPNRHLDRGHKVSEPHIVTNYHNTSFLNILYRSGLRAPA